MITPSLFRFHNQPGNSPSPSPANRKPPAIFNPPSSTLCPPPSVLYFLIIALCIPAFLLNLGMMPYTGDEAIRALVALEMELSGNYVATTMHGAEYLNKPPLFNWILLMFFHAWGDFGEWPSRICTVFFLAFFAYVVFRVARQHFEFPAALLAAVALVTNGHFLFYESMAGLIDTAFSLTVYALFMSLYYFGKRGDWGRLSLVSYALMGVGFLLKGFPALVFQVLSLAATAWFFGAWRKLFSRQHFAGALPGLAMIGGYLFWLSHYRDLNLFWDNLLHESLKRTAVEHGWERAVRHFFDFPFKQFYRFLPWSLLLIFWFDKRFWQKIRRNEFVFFNFILFAVNLPVYWTSVTVATRYMLMFIPLFNAVGLYLMEENRAENKARYRIFYYALGGLSVLAPVFLLALPFVDAVNYLSNIWLISIGLGGALIGSTVLYFRDKKRSLWWFAGSLLLLRIGFDLVVLPARRDESINTRARRDAYQLAEKYKDKTWYVYGRSEIREPASFYFTKSRGYIIQRSWNTEFPNALYLVNPTQHPNFPGRRVDSLQTDYPEVKHYLYVK